MGKVVRLLLFDRLCPLSRSPPTLSYRVHIQTLVSDEFQSVLYLPDDDETRINHLNYHRHASMALLWLYNPATSELNAIENGERRFIYADD